MGSESGRLEAASYGRRAAAAAAAAVAAEPPRGSGTKNSKNDLFRNIEAGTPPSFAPRSSVNLADISGYNHTSETWDPLSRFTMKTMGSEAYGFPLKPFLSVLCYLWPSPHGARILIGLHDHLIIIIYWALPYAEQRK